MTAKRDRILEQIWTWQKHGRDGIAGIEEEIASLPMDSSKRAALVLLKARMLGSQATLDNVEMLFRKDRP